MLDTADTAQTMKSTKWNLIQEWEIVDFRPTSGWFNIYTGPEAGTYVVTESPGVLIQELRKSYQFRFIFDGNGKPVSEEQRDWLTEDIGSRRAVFSYLNDCNELEDHESADIGDYLKTVNRDDAEHYREETKQSERISDDDRRN